MGGLPADLGDWSLVRVSHESSRLLKKHVRDFLPVILLFIFPASLIKVLHTQFRVADFVGHQGSTVREPGSIWTRVLLSLSLDAVPPLLNFLAFCVMFQIAKDKIFCVDVHKTEGHSKSFFATLKLAFTPQTFETETSALWKNEQVLTTFKKKRFKAAAAIFLCVILFLVISMSGANFTPEAIAAMGLPPWTIFMFTLLTTVITTLCTSYFLLTGLLVGVWTWIPPTPISV